MASGRKQRDTSPLHGLWIAVFALEALVLREDRGAQIGATVLGVLFAVLLVSELRNRSGDPD